VQWARLASGTLLVVRQDSTRRHDLAVAGESLRYVGSTVVGAALVASGRSLPGLKRLGQLRKSTPEFPAWTPAPEKVAGRPFVDRGAEPADWTPASPPAPTLGQTDATSAEATFTEDAGDEPRGSFRPRKRSRRARATQGDGLSEPAP
jgi:hypothetical protein